jgi:hypothetical protein
MTVKDHIENLKKLPQDLEVWFTWDESGQCWPVTSMFGETTTIKRKKRLRKFRMEECDPKEKNAKKVFLVNG